MRDALIVTRHYAPEPIGSAPVIQEIAEWMAKHQWSVDVLTVRPSYPARELLQGYAKGERDDVTENGVHVRRLPTRAVSKPGMLSRIGPEFGFLGKLLAMRLTGKAKARDRVLSLCPSVLTVVGARAFIAPGGRHVAIVHDIPSGLGAALGGAHIRMLEGVLKALEKWALNNTDHIIVLSDAMHAAVRALGVTTPIDVLPPQVAIDNIYPLPRPAGAPPTLMYSGNFGRKQGLDLLLDLAKILAVRAPEVVIVMRGEGSDGERLIQRAKSEQLHNVRLEGLVAKEHLNAALAEGDIHLVPQVREGSDFAVPSKAFVLMAAARPFIATADPGSELAKLAALTGAFICVPPGDADALAEAACRLLNDRQSRDAMGARGRTYVETEVSSDVVVGRLTRILEAADQ